MDSKIRFCFDSLQSHHDLLCRWCRPLSKLHKLSLPLSFSVFELFQSVSVISSTEDPDIYKLVDWSIISTMDRWTRCYISIAFFEILIESIFCVNHKFRIVKQIGQYRLTNDSSVGPGQLALHVSLKPCRVYYLI